MFTKLSCAIVALVCLLGMTPVSFGSILPVLTGPSGAGLRDNYTAVGFQFTVGTNDLTVIAVGVWDYQADGSAPYNIPVDVYGVANNVVPADPTNTLTFDEPDGFRYVSVTPFTLLAGQTYVVEASYSPGGGELWHDMGAVTSSIYLGSPLVTIDHSTFGGGQLANVGEAFSGPNLLVIVPEPASLSLACLGCLALLRRRRA